MTSLPSITAPNALHGGIKGFDKVVWDAAIAADSLVLHTISADGEEGYPGKLDVTVTYTLTEDSLRIDYAATTDKPTLCNLTNHSYFNLAGHAAGTDALLAHQMMINGDAFTPIADGGAIPTGEIRPVMGTPMDFTSPKTIGSRINDDDEQLKYGAGYDHNWVLNKDKERELTLATRTTEPSSGRVMETWTTEPGVQFYSANYLDGFTGKGRCCLSPPQRVLPGNPALSRFTQPAELPDNRFTPRRKIPIHHDL